ncbi:MAG TPA: glycosyltransferase [Intrasporangium sp.]|uniref:galactofuranosyltransferase GlfT1 n=1 Tax=Intrasporangium sp. TaxID=1925024 RepID=UPI002D787090|nr:glycosyltransferase [Intrasporangium sp.]HET7399929.1 glycosyltransferase [Intrasporangium sp.]
MPDAVPPVEPDLARRAADTVAVVVTRDRVEQLAGSLAALAAQRPAPGHVIVVDNGADPAVRDVVEGLPVAATWLPSRRNLGGAGGFALGMLHALARGAAYVWLADDDGRPGSPDTLATLLRAVRDHGLAMASPAVVDADAPDRLAFPTRRALRRITHVGQFGAEVVPGFAALFNGALFTAECVEAVGVPDVRLFLRGDEIEMHRRLTRAGLPFGTVTTATYVHPSGAEEFHGPLNVELPPEGPKRFYTFRNRGYLTNQPGKRLKRPLEYAVYTAFFLGIRRSPAEFRTWLVLMNDGRRERFRRYDGP